MTTDEVKNYSVDDNQKEDSGSSYPLTFSVKYPEKLSRLTTFFRLFMAIPIAIIVSIVLGAEPVLGEGVNVVYYVAGTLSSIGFATALLIIFRYKYPRWWFDFHLEAYRFSTRVSVYVLLLRDEYPSTDEHQAVKLDIAYPDVQNDLNRFFPLIKWLLAIPHYIVLFALWIVSIPVVVVAWFAILITGKYPRPLFDYIVNVQRWGLRVWAYVSLLATDKYPPFTFSN